MKLFNTSITAEKVRKKYVNGKTQEFTYYRCSSQGRSQKCSQRDKTYMREIVERGVSYRQSEVEEIFQDIFKSISFDEVTCQRMIKILKEEHCQAKEVHTSQREALHARLVELDTFIDQSYEDKLKRRIREDVWAQKNRNWNLERDSIQEQLSEMGEKKDEYMQRGVQLIELMQHAEIIYKNADEEKKRKMVELVSSNLLLKDGNIEYHWRKLRSENNP